MTDNDLIRRGDAINACRESVHRYEAHDAINALPAVKPSAPDAAANRIEELTEQLAAARDDAEEAEAYAEELEVNLAKAAEGLMGASRSLRTIAGMDLMGASAVAWNAAREIKATLAEIKGESHD